MNKNTTECEMPGTVWGVDLRKPTFRSAFTLIELLVVISIIAILAAVLFPVFAQAKETAKKATCISNVKQISLAFVLYTTDYDDTWPTAQMGNRLWNTGLDQSSMPWIPDFTQGYIYPYTKSSQITDCMSAQGLPGPWWYDSKFLPIAYGTNLAIMKNSGYTQTSEIELPAETLLLGDNAGFLPGTGDLQRYHIIFDNYNWCFLQARHNHTTVIGWADGHAKSQKLNYLTEIGSMSWLGTSEDLRVNSLGYALKYPRVDTAPSGSSSPVDWYYYRLQKVLP